MISQLRLRELLDYDPQTGVFRWYGSRPGASHGKVAGCLHKASGLIYIGIGSNRDKYRADKLAILYVEGVYPDKIEHIDKNKLNNAYENLRYVVGSDDYTGRPIYAPKKSGVVGVNWNSSLGKWFAQIKAEQFSVYLGVYRTILDAACARLAAEQCLDMETEATEQYVRKMLSTQQKRLTGA